MIHSLGSWAQSKRGVHVLSSPIQNIPAVVISSNQIWLVYIACKHLLVTYTALKIMLRPAHQKKSLPGNVLCHLFPLHISWLLYKCTVKQGIKDFTVGCMTYTLASTDQPYKFSNQPPFCIPASTVSGELGTKSLRAKIWLNKMAAGRKFLSSEFRSARKLSQEKDSSISLLSRGIRWVLRLLFQTYFKTWVIDRSSFVRSIDDIDRFRDLSSRRFLALNKDAPGIT